MAKTAAVSDPKLDPNSPEGQAVWGNDLLGAAIPVGERGAGPRCGSPAVGTFGPSIETIDSST